MSTKSKRLSMLEIINETISFYGKDNSRRAVNAKTTYCEYNTEDGRHCAVGRCLLTKYQKRGIELEGNVGANPDTLAEKNDLSRFDSMLQMKYRGHEHKFWQQLQMLHDGDNFWCDNGLTDSGAERVKELKERFGIVE